MFMPSPRPAIRPIAVEAPAQRYYIMGAESLPSGAAFAVPVSQHHLLTEFAMGNLSVAEVVACLTAKGPALPLTAVYPV
jgi:hypothetical protein